MYLKKLEMLGFKSFADRTELVFQPGMTAIVGPNGCGKSNVVDAFKWIFGEQSAKGMRGTEMKDIIFNGTMQRKPTGFAEVTIVFDNSDRFLDVDYAEVAIARRLYRSGESEYLINKQRCRLKDIRGLFMGTGIGQTSYSILEQGKIDALLQANNVERRFIFEEAAGISKYLSRKAETLRALLRVEENLLRLNDIIAEVEKRLQRVKAQASRARRYRELSERLKELRVRSAVDDYRESVEARSVISARLYWADFRQAWLEQLLATLSGTLEGKITGRRVHGETVREARDRLASERLLLERTRERLEHGRRRVVELGDAKSKKLQELEALTASLGQITDRIVAQRRELEATSADIADRRERCSRIQGELDGLRRLREDLENALLREKEALVERFQRRSRLGNSVIQLDAELANLRGQIERLRGEMATFQAQIAARKQEEGARREELTGLRHDLEAVERQRAETASACALLQSKLRALEEDLLVQTVKVNQKKSRLEILRSLEENLEGVSRSVADILRKQASSPELSDVHGMVGALLKVERRFARAVEAALGVHAQSLVVETQEGALGLLDFARTEHVGALEVITLDRVDSVVEEHFPRQAGVLGPILERIEVPVLFEGLCQRLFANVVLVEDFQTGLALSRNGLRPFRIVTLEGELIEPWGGIAIAGENELGIISRRSEMEDLRAEVTVLEALEGDLRDRSRGLARELEHGRADEERLRARASAISMSLLQAESGISEVLREIERLEREMAVGASEVAEMESQIVSREDEKRAVEAQAAELDGECRSAEARIAAVEGQIASSAEREGVVGESLTQVRLGLAQAQEREDSLCEMVRREEANLVDRRQQRTDLEQETVTIDERLSETRNQLRSGVDELREAAEREVEGTRAVEALEALDRELEGLEQSLRTEMDNVRQETGLLQKERESAHLRDQEERHRRNSIVQRLEEEYGLDLIKLLESSPAAEQPSAPSGEAEMAIALPVEAAPEAKYLHPDGDWDREKAREEIREIQEKLRRMGAVNLEALDELDELEKRHEFQLAQKHDLVESEKNLKAIIAEINGKSREMFLKTFEEVQLHFTELFRKCFGGGKAELVLEDGADILEAGIDIVAKPPGKKITSLSLMSGGEKTMTTIALLFALFRARPGPFCILDEVDAPLDETNVRRFVVLLQDFLTQTQFVVVTHNKITMAEANTLYGITMQEHGVSKRVSVELESYDPEELEPAARS